MSRRTERIAGQLQAEIARVLREDATDPRIRLVTVTRVDVAPDLSHALVFWSALVGEDPEELERVADGLDSAASFVRGRLARTLPLKRMPALQFRFDPSLSEGSRTLELLKTISHDETT